MPRPIWEGHITFGLVAIPVKLYGAEDSGATVSFHQIDRRTMGPVHLKRVNEQGEEVPWEEIVKGYELDDGSFVALAPEDFERANVEATRTIEIVQTANADEIDPVYFAKPYYLAPSGKGGEKPYALLRETLRRQGRAALARIVIRTREHLAAIYPDGDVLVLDLLRYAHELREPDALDLPASDLDALEVTDRELELADQLVEALAAEWRPSDYRDAYRDDILALIEEKRSAGETYAPEPVPPRAEPGAEVIDLMALLKRSLDDTQPGGSEEPKTGDSEAQASSG